MSTPPPVYRSKPENSLISFGIHMQEKPASQEFLSGAQLTLHATRRTLYGALRARLVQAMSA